jgi:hypothetical protein
LSQYKIRTEGCFVVSDGAAFFYARKKNLRRDGYEKAHTDTQWYWGAKNKVLSQNFCATLGGFGPNSERLCIPFTVFFHPKSNSFKMKQILFLAALVALSVGLNSCGKTEPVLVSPVDSGLSQEIKAKISALGFSADEAYATEGGYIVEGDIFLSDEDLSAVSPIQSLIVGNVEHYRTTNLVTGLPRVLRVRYTGSTTSISNAINAAIARYNARAGLRVTFVRVTTAPFHITVSNVSGTDYIASAGFPSGGNPYPTIRFNTAYAGWNANTLTTVLAHEMGHCIGFRHTDYMNRAYSCGTGGNEGSAGVGAIHIPGTPTGPSAASWMLACINNGTNRPFTASDGVALDYVY